MLEQLLPFFRKPHHTNPNILIFIKKQLNVIYKQIPMNIIWGKCFKHKSTPYILLFSIPTCVYSFASAPSLIISIPAQTPRRLTQQIHSKADSNKLHSHQTLPITNHAKTLSPLQWQTNQTTHIHHHTDISSATNNCDADF